MKSWNWKELTDSLTGETLTIFRGLLDENLRIFIREGMDFLYLDNAYFHRGARATKFRLIRKGLHLTHVLDRPDDRIKALGIEAKPWRKAGRNVLVIPPSPYHTAIYDSQGWLDDTVETIGKHTDRPVVVKWEKRAPLLEFLDDAWCVVTYASVAGVEAAVYGVPVFSGPICPTLPITAGHISNIDNPSYPDRGPWLRSLAYAQYDISEFDKLNLKDYNYSCGL